MTKQSYYEMCEMLGNEPNPEEEPLEYSDFPLLFQVALQIYNTLPDQWDTMGGNYMGKDYTVVFQLYELYGVEPHERLLALQFMHRLDGVKTVLIAEKLKQKSTHSPQT